MSKSFAQDIQPSQPSPTVVLFDVDGTLIRTEGQSRHSRAFRGAFLQMFGTEAKFTFGMHGMTDLQICIALTRELPGIDGQAEELAAEACRRMVEIYRTPEETDGFYVQLPGALETLELLSERGALLGLLTGNAPEIARDKLESVQLDRFFAFGAFGTEGENRSVLPPIAVARAEGVLNRAVDRSRVFVVGDTPRDVACALENGCRSIAVATGNFSAEQLAEAGAELVLPSLLDPMPLLLFMDDRWLRWRS